MNTVALALLAPLLLVLTFGVMESGRILSAWLVITNEAQEAARFGAVNYGREDADLAALVGQRVRQRLSGVLPSAGLYPEPTIVLTDGASPGVSVTLFYRVDLALPLLSGVLPSPFPLAARAETRGE